MSVGVVTATGVDEPAVKRGVVLLSDHRNLDAILVWLRDSVGKAVQQGNMRPVNFHFKADDPANPQPLGTWLNFWNWSLTTETHDAEFNQETDQTRDWDTDEPVFNANGAPVYDELWEVKTTMRLKFYNKRDGPIGTHPHRMDANELHFQDDSVELIFDHYERNEITPSNFEDPDGVTFHDASDQIYPPHVGPDLVFEQELDDVAGFHPIGKPHFVAKFHDGPGMPAIVYEHIARARAAFIATRMGVPAADALAQGMKTSNHYFTTDSVSGELADEEEFDSSTIKMNRTWRSGMVLRPRAMAFYTQKLLRQTRRAEDSPPGKKRPEKQPRERLGSKLIGCDLCRRTQAKFSCEGCDAAVYCGQECQETAWVFGHHQLCKPVH